MRFLLITILLMLSGTAFADTKAKVKYEMDCKFVDTKKHKVLYDYYSKVKEKVVAQGKVHVVKFNNCDKHRIEETDNGYTLEAPNSITEVSTMKDKGEKGVFKWVYTKLVVNTNGHSASHRATDNRHYKRYEKNSNKYEDEGNFKINSKYLDYTRRRGFVPFYTERIVAQSPARDIHIIRFQ